jgi:hypothetical protein
MLIIERAAHFSILIHFSVCALLLITLLSCDRNERTERSMMKQALNVL